MDSKYSVIKRLHCTSNSFLWFLLYSFISLVLHEAVATGDPELVQLVLKYRDHQRYTKRSVGVPELLQKLKEVSTVEICIT